MMVAYLYSKNAKGQRLLIELVAGGSAVRCQEGISISRNAMTQTNAFLEQPPLPDNTQASVHRPKHVDCRSSGAESAHHEDRQRVRTAA